MQSSIFFDGLALLNSGVILVIVSRGCPFHSLARLPAVVDEKVAHRQRVKSSPKSGDSPNRQRRCPSEQHACHLVQSFETLLSPPVPMWSVRARGVL